MVRLTSNLAYRFRWAMSRNQSVGRNFSWRRNYAAQDYRFGVEESPFKLATTIGDRRIGELMVEAVKKVGNNGLYLISVVEKVINELEFDNRMHLDWRFVLTYGPYFINDEWNKKCVCVVVSTRNRAEKNKAIMEDLAIFTGGQVVTAVSDINSISSMLGSCQEVIISILSMTIIGGSGSQKNIDKRREQLESRSVVAASCSELEFLKERLANLSLRAATFKVGGVTSEEIFKNSIRACNVVSVVEYAIKDGFVAGGGVALLHASKELDKVQITNFTQKLGVQLFQHVLKWLFFDIWEVGFTP